MQTIHGTALLARSLSTCELEFPSANMFCLPKIQGQFDCLKGDLY